MAKAKTETKTKKKTTPIAKKNAAKAMDIDAVMPNTPIEDVSLDIDDVMNEIENKTVEDNTPVLNEEMEPVVVEEKIEETEDKKENEPKKRRTYETMFGSRWMGYGFSE